MTEHILETWYINNRVNLMLIDVISVEGLGCTLSKRGGRTTAQQFVHLHNLRIWRLERFAREFSTGQIKMDAAEKTDKELLRKRLTESADAIAQWFEKGTGKDGKIKGF